MGVNWIPGVNPESIPRLRFVPAIALPTVFGDALSYMEQVGKVNAAINGVIDNVNNLANDIVGAVAESIEGARIPVYGRLVYNQGEILAPENWSLENVNEVYQALQAGKLVILTANCDFNDDGYAVYDSEYKQMFVLTQYYATNFENTVIIYTKFINFTETELRWVDIEFRVTSSSVTAEIQNFQELGLPTSDRMEALKALVGKKVMLYKGDPATPAEEGQYVELTANGTLYDLKRMFVVNNEDNLYANEICPCVCVDLANGYVGVLKFGTPLNPWVRLYSVGLKIRSDIDATIGDIEDEIQGLSENFGSTALVVERLVDDVDTVNSQMSLLGGEITGLDASVVKYEPQERDAREKRYARENIDAMSATGPVMRGTVSLVDDYNNVIEYVLDNNGAYNFLLFERGNPIIRGVHDPLIDTDVATKRYVDHAIPDLATAVLFVEQTLSDGQQSQARTNIGAVGSNNPAFTGVPTIEHSDVVLGLNIGRNNGRKVLYFTGSAGNTVLRNVAAPVNDEDAANKRYVDSVVNDAGNNVKYVPQTLTASERATARDNIGAIGSTEVTLINGVSIYRSDGNEPYIEFEDDVAENRILIVLDSDGQICFKDTLTSDLIPIKVEQGYGDNNPITWQYFSNRYAPITVTLDYSNNTWSATDNLDFAAIVNNFRNGKNVIIVFQPTIETPAAYCTIKSASYDYIWCEAFDGTNWQRIRIGSNGNFSVTQL